MKTVRKSLSLLLAAVIMISLFGCGADTKETTAATAAPAEQNTPAESAASDAQGYAPHKIAVMWGSMTAAEMLQVEYLQSYVGPHFNCEFVFSEALKDSGAAVAFVEQAHAAGCEAIMNFYSDGVEATTAMAEEYGMYIVTNTNRIQDSIKDLPHNLGVFGASIKSQAKTFSELSKPVLDDGNAHNVVIVSGGAAQGNMTHLEITVSLMQMICVVYGTTIDGDLTELAKSPARTEVVAANGTKIMLYPGYASADTYVSGFSSVLQSGEYDVVFCTYGVFSQLVQPIAEVEKAFGLDIKLVSIANVGDATASAFETGALDAAVLNPGALYAGALFVVVYNALEGNVEAIQQGNGALMYNFLKWQANNAEEYDAISKLDISDTTYAVTVADIESLLVSRNPSVNYDAINDFFSTLTAQVVMEKYGV